MPPWDPVDVEERTGGIDDGGRVVLRVPVGPLRVRWVAEHRDFEPGRQFRDVQVSGPFRRWVHTNRVVPDGPDACWLEDEIEYALPGGPLGRLLGGSMTRKKLDAMFRYRHGVTAADVADHLRWRATPMRVLVSGSTGLIGGALGPLLSTGGHEVVPLTRGKHGQADQREDAPTAVSWRPAEGQLDAADVEGFDAVVHLAGESIAGGRWTEVKKARILDSRVKGTRLLCETLARLERKPRVLAAASAIGFYGNRGEEELTEESPAGEGFLADVCRQWEEATQPAAEAGIRVVNVRIGVVLSPLGGALKMMLRAFRLGLGGKVGGGGQWVGWITRDDVARAIVHTLVTGDLAGPVNLTSPRAVTNLEMTKALGRVLRRPTILPAPRFALRAVLGQMADELLLQSARVAPEKLRASGFEFRDPELEPALRRMLGAG